MIHAILRNKLGQSLDSSVVHWKELFRPSEDSLTSSVFGQLLYLPTELFWRIISESCFDNSFPKECGDLIEYFFWPRWSSKETSNSIYVEPDLFLRFTKRDVIIEAKRNDEKQQNVNQWNTEIQSYKNEYASDNKNLIFIAIGGIWDKKTEHVGKVSVYKMTWSRVLHVVKKIYLEFDIDSKNKSYKRILRDLIEYFRIHGFFIGEWLNTLELERNHFSKSLQILFKE
ncbi:MAG: hypothetical protein JXR48_15245 [Candidatus Delongbacteria bacterium]|nr:hypothetical protein [Candidatus Delongbacteria bacterium]